MDHHNINYDSLDSISAKTSYIIKNSLFGDAGYRYHAAKVFKDHYQGQNEDANNVKFNDIKLFQNKIT